MNAIELVGLSKTFKGKQGAVVRAVAGLDLTVAQGEVFGFLGPNGAGKSTTIKMLMGLITPTSGSATLMGKASPSVQAKHHVGYLPENPTLYDFLTAEEYLGFVCSAFRLSGTAAQERIDRNLRLLDLWEARKRPIRGYSKGMVQRLGLAQAMIHDPDVYILDEPMSGLDPVGRALIKDIILDLRAKGKSVFFSTHITADVEMICDRVGIIVRGTLQSVEKVDTILTTGIVGYQVHIRMSQSGERRMIEVPAADLMRSMTEIQASGAEITLIDPKRKNVESFFLDIVKGHSC